MIAILFYIVLFFLCSFFGTLIVYALCLAASRGDREMEGQNRKFKQ